MSAIGQAQRQWQRVIPIRCYAAHLSELASAVASSDRFGTALMNSGARQLEALHSSATVSNLPHHMRCWQLPSTH
jgi:hypothetical protein